MVSSWLSKRNILFLFIIGSLFLRAYLSFFFLDSSLDIDEAKIVGGGLDLLQQGQFQLFFPVGSRWEMIPSYLYAFSWKIFGTGRPLSFLFGIFDLIVFWKISASFLSKRAQGFAIFFFALSPWHVFYSSIMGTCNLILLFVLLGQYLKERYLPAAWLNSFLGFLVYPTFRVVSFYWCFDALLRRKWKQIIVIVTSFLGCLFLVWLVEGSPFLFFQRGAYNVLAFDVSSVLNNAFSTLTFLWLPLRDTYALVARPSFMADYVHFFFAQTMRGFPPIGYTLLFLSLLVLYKKFRKSIPFWIMLGLLLLPICFLGPSYSRLIFLLPIGIIIASKGVDFISDRRLLALVMFFFLVENSFLYSRIINASYEQRETTFHERFERINNVIKTDYAAYKKENVFLIPFAGRRSAMYRSLFFGAHFEMVREVPRRQRDEKALIVIDLFYPPGPSVEAGQKTRDQVDEKWTEFDHDILSHYQIRGKRKIFDLKLNPLALIYEVE